jgi:hypothetical protein
MKKFDRSWWIAVAVLPVALALGGCSVLPGGGSEIPNVPSTGDGEVDDSVEEIVEGANGGDVDFEMGELPADFPVDDVPLVAGEVGPSFAVPGNDGSGTWQVTIIAPDEATAGQADDLLIAAGYSNESVLAFESNAYTVIVVSNVEAEDGTWQVSYIVTEK